MFWKGYCKSFSVWVEIVANYGIVKFCHPKQFTIFRITNFFSFLAVTKFYEPSACHIALLFLVYGAKVQQNSIIPKKFNFFLLLAVRSRGVCTFYFDLCSGSGALVVVACVPALVVAPVLVFLRSGFQSLRLPVAPALVASCTILLTSAKREYIRAYTRVHIHAQ